jgi:hypothetical protein
MASRSKANKHCADASRCRASVRGENLGCGHGQEATRQGPHHARPRGRSVGDEIGPACEEHSRSAQRPRCSGKGRCRLPILGRCVGRHDHGTWATYVDRARGACRVRAKLDPCEDQRGPDQGQGERSEVRPQTDPHPTSTNEALARRAAGEALVDIARSYAVSHSTISRLSLT